MIEEPILANEGIAESLKHNLFRASQMFQRVATRSNSTKSTSFKGIQESISHKSLILLQLYVKLLCLAI